MHYPPVTGTYLYQKKYMDFLQLMKKYHIQKCYYGHLHGASHKDAVEGMVEEIELKLISADYLDFNLVEV